MKKIIFTLISVFMFVGCVNNINDIEENNIIEPAPIENNDIKEESPKLEPNQFECGDIVWDTIRKNGVFIDGSCPKNGVDVYKIKVYIEKSVYYTDGIVKSRVYESNDDYNNGTFVAYAFSKYRIIFDSVTFAIIDIDAETNIATAKCSDDADAITFIAYDKESNLLTIKFNRTSTSTSN